MDTLNEVTSAHREIADDLAARGVRWISAVYPDVAGRPRGKMVPVGQLPQLAAGSERFTPRGLDGLGDMDPVEDECTTLPDVSNISVLPWNHEVAVMPADLRQEDETYPLCCRSILKGQLARAEALGFKFLLGVETEFYVFRRDVAGSLAPLWPSGRRQPSPAYLFDAAVDALGFLGPMVDAMNDLGFGVFSFDQEGGEGQYEFDFQHDDALSMADKLLLFRMMAKHYAEAAGGLASFMPKPTNSSWGSGAHFNMSLENDDGVNLFRDADHGWTDVARSFSAGILSHGRALAAITNPTVNSYKRLVNTLSSGGVSWAPTWVSVGDNNRSCMLRLPKNRPAVENRLVDSAANTYLSAAFLLAAGLDGIEQAMPLSELASGQAYSWSHSADHRQDRLPRNLLEAVDYFDADPFTHTVFPKSFVSNYIQMKEREWNEYHEVVTDWEAERYLTEL
jgi:glutamine synthetase